MANIEFPEKIITRALRKSNVLDNLVWSEVNALSGVNPYVIDGEVVNQTSYEKYCRDGESNFITLSAKELGCSVKDIIYKIKKKRRTLFNKIYHQMDVKFINKTLHIDIGCYYVYHIEIFKDIVVSTYNFTKDEKTTLVKIKDYVFNIVKSFNETLKIEEISTVIIR